MANPLTAERLRELLHYDPQTGIFTWIQNRGMRFIAGKVAGHLKTNGYHKITVLGKQYATHRLAWLYVYGEFPTAQIDHINLNKADNRIENLREATRSQNKANSRCQKNNSSGFKGTSFHRNNGKWQARIGGSENRKSLGYFRTAEEAHSAYIDAARELYGDFARST